MAGHKDLIIATCLKEGLLRNEAAYVLATTAWETNHTFEPVREAYYLKSKAEAFRKKLRYYPWYGRGFVQLTWFENYAKAGEAIGVYLTKDADLALEPNNAAKILVLGMKKGWFTGKKLSDYITLKRSNFQAARAIVNGSDKAKEIADLARKYDAELKTAGYGETPATPPPEPIIVTTPVGPPVEQVPVPRGNGNLIGAIIAIVLALGAGLLKLFGVN